MGRKGFSRRDFLRTTAIAATGGTAANSLAAGRSMPSEEGCGGEWERPPKQEGNNLNLIVIVSDTFRRDNLACYGTKWRHDLATPNLDRFAQNAVVFQDAYAEGMPTLVIRRALYTGRRVIPTYYFHQFEGVQLAGWHPLYHEDVTLSETLVEAGYTNSLISSIFHQFNPDRNFHRGFNTFQWIRGMEVDSYGTSPHKLLDVSDLVSSEYSALFPGLHGFLSQYKANRNLWKQQGESVSQIMAQTAIRWLNENFNQRPFCLHVEFFDPHEPWDPPRRFLEKYMPGATDPSFIQPPYGTVSLSDQIKERFRANYAGAVDCTDYWIGKLLATIDQFGLFENSVVVFMADHGALLGERGQFLKGPDKLRGQVTHIPLLIRAPRNPYAGKKVGGFVQIPDVAPTLLHLLGLKPSSRVTGTNLWPMVMGETSKGNDYVVQTYGWVGAVRNEEWSYSEIWKPEAHKVEFHLYPGGPLRAYQPQLYNLVDDPQELTDVADKYPEVCRRMSAKMKEYIASGEGLTFGHFNAKPSRDPSRGLYSK
jgi:arylsulfatase A-like enzyme